MSGHFIYWIVFGLLMIGLYVVITHGNLVKKLIGLNIFQGSVFLLVISLGYVQSGEPPIIEDGAEAYSHPLPHVLILTAIVVGVASTALGVALAVRIYRAFGTIEEDVALESERKDVRDESRDGGTSAGRPGNANPAKRGGKRGTGRGGTGRGGTGRGRGTT